MKILRVPMLFAVASLGMISLLKAQEVSTGMLESVNPKQDVVTMRSDQTHHDLVFYGLNRANIFTADGRDLNIRDLEEGQRVTIQYAVRNRRWYVSKVILSEPRPVSRSRALDGKARDRIREETEGDTRTPSAPTTEPVPPQTPMRTSGLNATRYSHP